MTGLSRELVISEQAISTIATAVFAADGAQVREAFSEFGEEARRFNAGDELIRYIHGKLSDKQGIAHFFVIYPDMAGDAVRRKIELKPNAVSGHTFRYTWEGWGIIWVILKNDQPGRAQISVNSKARAQKWQSTYPHVPAPETWNWAAVEKHARRLRRVVKRAVTPSVSSATM